MKKRPVKRVTNQMNREKRVEVRVRADVAIRVTVTHAESGKKIHGWVLNLSRGGLLVQTTERFSQETSVHVNALARDGQTLFRIQLNGWVVRNSEDGMGIQLDEPETEMDKVIQHLLARFSQAA